MEGAQFTALSLTQALDGRQFVQTGDDQGCSSDQSLTRPRHADRVVDCIAQDAKCHPYAEIGQAKQSRGGLPAATSLRIPSEFEHEWGGRGEHHGGHHHRPDRNEGAKGTQPHAHIGHGA